MYSIFRLIYFTRIRFFISWAFRRLSNDSLCVWNNGQGDRQPNNDMCKIQISLFYFRIFFVCTTYRILLLYILILFYYIKFNLFNLLILFHYIILLFNGIKSTIKQNQPSFRVG